MALIKIKHTNGNTMSGALDANAYLSAVRTKLTAAGTMETKDYFWNDGSKVEISSESELTLSELLNGGTVLKIGAGGEIRTAVTFEMFPSLTTDEKLAFFRQNQLTRGISFSEDGIKRSFYDLFTLKRMPSMSREQVNTKMESSYSFSKSTRDISLFTSDKQSVSFHAPFASAKAEFEHEKSKSTSTSEVEEFLLSKFVVSQAKFQIEPASMEVNADFYHAVEHAVNSKRTDTQRMSSLMEVLETWGLYVPVTFSMGGALYTSDEKKITDFKQTEKDKENFSVAAEAAFEGFGAGFNTGSTTESGGIVGTSKEFKNLVIKQIGGIPGNIENNTKFAATLTYISSWEIVDIKKFYPSIMLLLSVKDSGKQIELFQDTLELINENHYIAAVKKMQPYINMLDYATTVEGLTSPF